MEFSWNLIKIVQRSLNFLFQRTLFLIFPHFQTYLSPQVRTMPQSCPSPPLKTLGRIFWKSVCRKTEGVEEAMLCSVKMQSENMKMTWNISLFPFGMIESFLNVMALKFCPPRWNPPWRGEWAHRTKRFLRVHQKVELVGAMRLRPIRSNRSASC